MAWKVTNRHPDRWRYDAAGNLVIKALKGCYGPLCHEYDHIMPYSKGGETSVNNCQILQTYANRLKKNKIIEQKDLHTISYKVNLSEYQMDLLEHAIYGDIKREL